MARLGTRNRLLACTDSYKPSQSWTYPDGAEYVYSYITSRGGKHARTVWFGMQYLLKEYLSEPFTQEEVDEAAEVWAQHGEPFDKDLWDSVVSELGGQLPLEIRALPEGSVVGVQNALATVVNTVPGKYKGCVSYFEGLLMHVWAPTTVATNSYHLMQIFKEAYDISSDAVDYAGIGFKLHDFGYRGSSSNESAGICGLAHLTSFMGSDTMIANMFGRAYYHEPMASFSIPAGEHSCVTSYGKGNEDQYFKKMLKLYGKPGALWACPIDSYSTWGFIDNVIANNLEALKASGSTYVARPDSGDPLTVPVEVVKRLGALAGFTVNSKGYKVLPDYLRVIQGDGIDPDSLPQIIDNLLAAGWSIDNIAFGMGGGMHQKINRDDQKFAMKCSAICINGKWHDVFKDPIDQPDKKSMKGRFHVIQTTDGTYKTFNAIMYDIIQPDNQLLVVWKDGELLIDQTLAEIRERVAAG